MPGKVIDIRLNIASGQPMNVVESAEVIAGTGLAGDRHAKAGSDRQILVMDKSVMDELGLEAGQIRENLTVDGIELLGLQPGQKLTIGGSIEFEIGELCDPCSFVESIRPGLLEKMSDKRGIFVTPLAGGKISVGDEVALSD
ncbi:MAG: MOSC domain-containing protein [Chloroflexi bacterium]|nr:MOSC domain-containing protein [Chloroflexota bacterium]